MDAIKRKQVLDLLSEHGIKLGSYNVIVNAMPDEYYRVIFSHREDKRIYGTITIKINNQNQ
jgi:hypothetical protein